MKKTLSLLSILVATIILLDLSTPYFVVGFILFIFGLFFYLGWYVEREESSDLRDVG